MPEKWKPIVGYEGWYEVSSYGRVRSLDRYVNHDARGGQALRRGRLLRGELTYHGYRLVQLHQNYRVYRESVHRLVAMHFLPKPASRGAWEVNHKDFVRDNNHHTNLEWASRSDNHAHSNKAGRYTPLVSPKMAKKLTARSVEQMRKARTTGLTYEAIGRLFNVTGSTARRTVVGEAWAPRT